MRNGGRRAVHAVHGAQHGVRCKVQGLQDAFHRLGQALLVEVGGRNQPRRQNVCDSA